MKRPTPRGGIRDERAMNMINEPSDDTVANFISDYLASVERGTPPPAPDNLDPDVRAEVEDLLTQIDADFDIEVEVPPIEESKLAIERGIVRRPPAVAVHGDGVSRVRNASGLTASEVAAEMSRLGYTMDDERITEIEEAEATLLAPREARRLAAVIGVPLVEIEASADPWLAIDRGELDSLGNADALVEIGHHLAYRLDAGFHAGVIRCHGRARQLESLTFRRVAWTLLAGEWNQLHAAVLITDLAPRKVLVVPPFDCVPRWAAPSGDIGFGALEPAEDLGTALDRYNAKFHMPWSDPPAFFAPGSSPLVPTGLLDLEHVATCVNNIRRTINRLAEPKQGGYVVALGRLDDTGSDEFDRLIAAINESEGDQVETHLAEAIGT